MSSSREQQQLPPNYLSPEQIAKKERRSKTPIVSPKSENPWRPAFDQGTVQTQNLHQPAPIYDSDASNKNRLLVVRTQAGRKTQSPNFPTKSLQQDAVPRLLSDKEKKLDHYMKSPIRSVQQEQHQLPQQQPSTDRSRQLLEKYIREIDSEGEFRNGDQKEERKKSATPSVYSNYEADESSQSLVLPASTAAKATTTNNNKNHRPKLTARSKTPVSKLQEELSPAARAKRREQFREFEMRHAHQFHGQQQQLHVAASSTRSPSIASTAIRESQRQQTGIVMSSNNSSLSSDSTSLPVYSGNKTTTPTTKTEKEKLPSYQQAVNNNNNKNDNTTNPTSPPTSSAGSRVNHQQQQLSVFDSRDLFRKEAARNDFYLAAADQRNPLAPRERELRNQILSDERKEAEHLFRKIFGLLSYFWDEERNKMLEEKTAILNRVRNDPRYREQYENERKLKKKEMKKEEKRKRRRAEKELLLLEQKKEEEKQRVSESKNVTSNSNNNGGQINADFFNTLIRRLEQRTQRIQQLGSGTHNKNNSSTSRIRSEKDSNLDDDDDDEDTKGKKKQQQNNNSDDDDVSTDPDSSDEEEEDENTTTSTKRKNNQTVEKDKELERMILLAQRERKRAEHLANENSLLQDWLSMPSSERFDPAVPIDHSLVVLGETKMREKIEKAESLMRNHLFEIFLNSLKQNWEKEQDKHFEHESRFAREKESLDKRVQDHEEIRSKQIDENFNNILKLRDRLYHRPQQQQGTTTAAVFTSPPHPSSYSYRRNQQQQQEQKQQQQQSSPSSSSSSRTGVLHSAVEHPSTIDRMGHVVNSSSPVSNVMKKNPSNNNTNGHQHQQYFSARAAAASTTPTVSGGNHKQVEQHQPANKTTATTTINRSPSPLPPAPQDQQHQFAAITPRNNNINNNVTRSKTPTNNNNNQLVTVVTHHEENGIAPRNHPTIVPMAPVDD